MPALAQGAVADMIDDWSREWIAGEPLRALGSFVRMSETRAELRGMLRHACDGVAFEMREAGLAALGALILGLADRYDRPRADLDLLEPIGTACLDALEKRAARLFGLEPGAGWSAGERAGGGAHRLTIGLPDEGFVLTLELSAARFASFVRAKLPQPPAPMPLGPPADALADLPARLSAVLGSCALTVAELATLGPGDVLVLDADLDAALPLAVDGRPAPRGACTVAAGGDAVALEISEALAG
ncbi:MAG: FliM/FliN family flagellar motor switch protein [Sphingomonas sp.]